MNNTTQKARGITCNIFRWSLGDCSAGGISSKVNRVVLIDAAGHVKPSDDAPAVRLVKRKIGREMYVHAEPVEAPRAGTCRMAGGAFIYSCDSRYREAVGHSYPISLHDRDEVQR